MARKFDPEMDTNSTYQPNKAYAWGAAAQINMIADADDPDLWDMFFGMLRQRGIYDELAHRMQLDNPGDPDIAA